MSLWRMNKRFLGLACLVAVVANFPSCNKREFSSLNSRMLSVETCSTLAPSDLRIEKRRFKAKPNPDEVAIFRCRCEDKEKPGMSLSLDQIYWANGIEVHEDLVIAPLSFYLGYPPENQDKPQFRDSWRLSAGNFNRDVNEYSFIGSKYASSLEKVTGKAVYSKNLDARTEDLVFTFEMFVMSFEDAKNRYPEIAANMGKGTASWKAVFLTP
jgi:hypothetical protein